MKTKLHYVLSIATFLVIFYSFGQDSSWKSLKNIKNTNKIEGLGLNKNNAKFFKLDVDTFKAKTKKTSLNSKKYASISLPDLEGRFITFNIKEVSVLEPSLAAKYPNIKSYRGTSTNKSGAKLYMSTSPKGMQAMVNYPNKPNVFIHQINKKDNEFVVYTSASKKENYAKFNCLTKNNDLIKKTNKTKNTAKTNDNGGANDQTLQKFRIAISTNGEYSAYYGNTITGVLAGINATLTRVNAIFETDMAITFELVDATNLIFLDPDTDPYSGVNNSDNWSDELQNTLTNTIGNNNYDIGHLLGSFGGTGNGGCLGCVCTDGIKGRGYSAASNNFPEGDTFDLNLVAHEIGHQMGGNHTWAFDSEGTDVQSEPGSGSTIMAYAGITNENDLQTDSDLYFHYHSIEQILSNVANKNCQTRTPLNNAAPNANAGNNFSIPIGTAYKLTGNATDTDTNDILTYCWEQIDSGVVNTSNFNSNLQFGSINRSLPPTESPIRLIPNITNVINGQLTTTNPGLGSPWESVSTVARTLNWALTVRDRNPENPVSIGQTSYDTMSISVIDTERPFTVTSQNTTGINWTPSTKETITWDVANTNTAPINTSEVNILLSTDGGLTYPITLLSNTPNDGSQNIVVPSISAAFCRIKVEAVDNIFYAINSTDFAINFTVVSNCPPTIASNSNLNIPILDGQVSKNTINVNQDGLLQTIKVNVDISHTFINDLIVKITHPNGSISSNVWNRNCFSNQDIVVSFEEFASSIDCDATRSQNTFAPAESLTPFKGLDVRGIWEISIEDFGQGDTGTLNSWSLDLCYDTITKTDPNITDDVTITDPNNTDDTTGNDITPGSLNVFPNPNKGNFNIEFVPETKFNIDVIISDVRGRIIYNKTFPFSDIFKENIQLNDTQSGLYVLSISDGTILKKTKILIN